jgi:hypothetical protein
MGPAGDVAEDLENRLRTFDAGGGVLCSKAATTKMWQRLLRHFEREDDIFALGAPVLEKIMRPIVVYIFLVVALRVFGSANSPN